MANEISLKCAHLACECEVTAKDDGENIYCSEQCQIDAEEEDQDECACGHPPCDSR